MQKADEVRSVCNEYILSVMIGTQILLVTLLWKKYQHVKSVFVNAEVLAGKEWEGKMSALFL